MPLKLTSKEKQVLYGMARYPGLSDIDLASRIGVDRSTIFKSKRKFREWQLIKLMNVPSGIAVGAEILTAVIAWYKPTAPLDVRKMSGEFGRWVNHPNCVFHTSTDSESVSMVYTRSLTEFKSVFNPIIDGYRGKDFLEDVRCYHYPFQLTSSSCDSALAVDNTFGLERTDLQDDTLLEEGSAVVPQKLTEKDKLALYAFVKYPTSSDLELSRRTGVSRPTISGKRSKFFQNNLLSRQAYVDWQKIGCELMSFYHVDVKPGASNDDMMRVYSSFRSIGAALFSYIQPGEVFGSFLSHGYPDLSMRMNKVIRHLAEDGLIQERPLHVIVPLREIKVKKIDYAPMVKEMLGVDKVI